MTTLLLTLALLTLQQTEPETIPTAGSIFTPTFEISAGGGYQFHFAYQDTLRGAPHFNLSGRFHLPFLPGLLVGLKLHGSTYQLVNDTSSSIWWIGANLQLGYRLQLGLFDIALMGSVGGGLGIFNDVPNAEVNLYGTTLGDVGLEFGFTFAQQHRIAAEVRLMLYGETAGSLAPLAIGGSYTLILGNRSVPPLDITPESLPTLIPPRYRQYPMGKPFQIKVSNPGSDRYTDLNATLRITGLGNLTAKGPSVAELAPGDSAELQLASPFDAAVLDIVDERELKAEIVVSYTRGDSTFTQTVPVSIPALPRNSITWDDTRHIGNFLSLRDSDVAAFARNVIAAADAASLRPLTNLDRAMALLIALDEHGIVYNKDPQTPFDTLTASTVDSIQFPRELLRNKAGDCDDMVTLMMSLLESLGIATATITVPSHIFMAVDSGVQESELWKIGGQAGDVILRDGRAWLPIEVTVLNRGFTEAWRTAVQQLGEHDGNWELIPAVESMRAFGPATPEFEERVRFGAEDLFSATFAEQQSLVLQTLASQALPGFTSRRSQAIVQAFFGQLDDAEASLIVLLDESPNDIVALIALSEVQRLQGKVEQALATVLRATEIGPDEVIAWRQLLIVAEAALDDAIAADARRKLEELSPESLRESGESGRASDVASVEAFGVLQISD